MAAKIVEIPASESGTVSADGTTDELRYVVFDTFDRNEVDALVEATAPPVYRDKFLLSYDVAEEEPGDQWSVTCRYSPTPPRETGEDSFSFDTTGGTKHVKVSKQTIASYGVSPPNFKNAIGFDGRNVEGVDALDRAFKFSITRYIAPEDMTAAYVQEIYTLTGRVNSAAVTLDVDGVALTFAAGELLFEGGSGSKRRRKGDWEISLKFAASPNATGLTVGDIGGIAKKGWEYLWVRFKEDVSSNALVKQPEHVYVERIYDTGDLNALLA